MATNLELWMSCTCPIRKMGGHSSEHVVTCPVHDYLARYEADIEESLSSIGNMYRQGPILFMIVLAYFFVLPATVGFAVGSLVNAGWGWVAFLVLQVGVFLPKASLPEKKP